MSSGRKHSLNEGNSSEIRSSNESSSSSSNTSERLWRRASFAANPLMNKLKPFIYGAKSDDVPECYNRVRYIRDSCKVLSDVWKSDKDFLNKSMDNDISKSFKEFRSSEVGRNYRSPDGSNGIPSILNETIDDFIQIHEYIDSKRKEWLEQLKTIIEQAKDKQSNIRQTMSELRENYERAQRKLETADGNLKKFQTRSDRLTLNNFDERSRELEDLRSECEQSRTLARDIYSTEISKTANEEYSITVQLFSKYLNEENHFYEEIFKYFQRKMPQIEDRINEYSFQPSFRCDLAKHCSTRLDTNIAYPIETSIRLLQNHLREEGLFRLAPSHIKQKKFVAELDLQLIDRTLNLNELGYDPHVPASTLKQYLRELPDCLLTSQLFKQWNDIHSITNEQNRLQRIAQLINQLPKVNYDNLCYLVRFLARVCEYSQENKMTASNLAICIGCSLLYPSDQSSSSSSSSPSSNSYTNGSMILELMILHHKQFFPTLSQQDQSSKSFKSQPDLIPTEFHPSSRSGSNENLVDNSNASGIVPPSPGGRRKNKAPPPPPPPPPSSSSIPIQETVNEEETSSEQTLNVNAKVTSSSSFNSNDRTHRRTPSDGIQLERPGAPPPIPPSFARSSSPNVQMRERNSIPKMHSNEQLFNSTNEEEKNPLESLSTATNDTVNVGKLISELNNRMAQAKTNSPQTNSIRASSIRNSTLQSPGETTDF